MGYSLEQLQALKKAYASGALRVRFGDREVTYQSAAEMRRIIAQIERELGLKPKMQVVPLSYSKGV